jgi:NAD(P)-dependent dehydrogenase (short-subunit alcohol dehydrogenase family)
MSSYLVTGAGRGLGLEFVRQLSQRPVSEVSTVFATIRGSPSEALQKLADESNGRLVILHMALSDKSSIATAVEQVKDRLAGRGLDVLINNAGIMPATPEGIAAMDNLQEVIQVNVETVQNVTSAFLPLLKEGSQKKVLNL